MPAINKIGTTSILSSNMEPGLFSHTIDAGTDVCCLVVISMQDSADIVEVSWNPTGGGDSRTFTQRWNQVDATSGCRLVGLTLHEDTLAPLTLPLTQDIEVDLTGMAGYSVGATNFDNVLAATPIYNVATIATGNSGTASVDVSGGSADDMAVDVGLCASVPTIGSGQTLIMSENQNGRRVSSYEQGTHPITMDWTFTTGLWGIIAADLQATGGAPPTPPAPGVLAVHKRQRTLGTILTM